MYWIDSLDNDWFQHFRVPNILYIQLHKYEDCWFSKLMILKQHFNILNCINKRGKTNSIKEKYKIESEI